MSTRTEAQDAAPELRAVGEGGDALSRGANIFRRLAEEWAGARVLICADEDLASDQRLRQQAEAFRAVGCEVRVCDVAQTPPREGSRLAEALAWGRMGLSMGSAALSGLRGLGIFRDLWRSYGLDAYQLPFWGPPGGGGAAFYDLGGARVGIRRRREWSRGGPPDLIVANNLVSLMAAQGAFPGAEIPLVYDAHELNFMRFRDKMSVARCFMTFALERRFARAARRVLTVNAPSREIYAKILERDDVATLCNDFYPDHVAPHPAPDDGGIQIAFFGAARSHRGLSRLGRLALADEALRLRFYLVGDKARQQEALREACGAVPADRLRASFGLDYQGALAQERQSGGVWLSWCVIEDACLSYRLSFPNKAAQSLRARLPLAVAAGGYLAQIVERFGVGIVLSAAEDAAEDLAKIHALARRPPEEAAFAEALRCMRAGLV